MKKEISIREIKGIRIGQAENAEAGTGCTVFLSEKGMAAGLEKGIHGMIVSLRECAVPDAVILQKLQKRFALTAEKAEAYLQEAQD